MADFTFVAATATEDQAGNAADITLTVPAGVQDGDVLLALVVVNFGTDPTSSFATRYTNATYFAGTHEHHLFMRVASSEPASYVFDWAGTTTVSQGMMAAYRPASGVTLDAVGTWTGTGGSLGASATTPATLTYQSTKAAPGTQEWLLVNFLSVWADGATSVTQDMDNDYTEDALFTTEVDTERPAAMAVGSRIWEDTGGLDFPADADTWTRTGGTTIDAAHGRAEIPYTGNAVISVDPNKNRYTRRRLSATALPHDLRTMRDLG